MLEEFRKVAQEKDADGPRRWFSDAEMDLVVWGLPGDGVAGFMLSYGKSGRERAFEWRRGGSLRHFDVDDGEATPLRNDTPVLRDAGPGDRKRVLADFLARSGALDAAIVDAVTKALT